MSAENPGLIYCAISGFGQDGPRKDDPAYDQIVQGISGVMSITGASDTAPYRVGYPLADTVGGMTAAFSITAALNASPRGAFLDCSMTDAVISAMGWVVSNYLIGGVHPEAHGNENTTSAPSGTFETADQQINIAANRDEQWALRSYRSSHRGGTRDTNRPRNPYEHRRCDGCNLCRVGFCPTACAGVVLPFQICRDSCSCMGAVSARGPKQGTNTTVIPLEFRWRPI